MQSAVPFAVKAVEDHSVSAVVEENHLFVMGDNRNNSKDSRNPTIGFVDEQCVLGKVMLRIAPFEILA